MNHAPTSRISILASEHGVDLKSLQRSIYPVMMDELLSHLESKPGSFASVAPRLRLPQFAPIVNKIRDYQWLAVQQLFRCSGFVVSPCGSGKTLIGCLIAALNGGRSLVLTTRFTEQWKHALETFFVSMHTDAYIMVADNTEMCLKKGFPSIVLSTYSCFSANNERTRVLKQLIYDTVILDEAHTAAAKTYLQLIDKLHCVWACGLTATKVREDGELEKLESRFNKVPEDLNVHIIDRRQLVQRGFVANVRVVHLIVEYIALPDLQCVIGTHRCLSLHPHKIQVLMSSLQELCKNMHKTIVFCDDLFALNWVLRIANANEIPNVGQVTMKTPQDERSDILKQFSQSQAPMVLFMSRTGDEALDLPSATASIVFWNNWASRRQIVQRIGRLARPYNGTQPIFIVILADERKELENSMHREEYLKEHGFAIEKCRQEDTPFGVQHLKLGENYTAQLLMAWKDRNQKMTRKS